MEKTRGISAAGSGRHEPASRMAVTMVYDCRSWDPQHVCIIILRNSMLILRSEFLQ
jgi:hypothetical protein